MYRWPAHVKGPPKVTGTRWPYTAPPAATQNLRMRAFFQQKLHHNLSILFYCCTKSNLVGNFEEACNPSSNPGLERARAQPSRLCKSYVARVRSHKLHGPNQVMRTVHGQFAQSARPQEHEFTNRPGPLPVVWDLESPQAVSADPC